MECGGFDDAAVACRTANQTVALMAESLAGKLTGFAGMAGNDSSSAQFASSYDAAAAEAVGSLADLTHAFIGLGRLLSATGAHHSAAEAAAAGKVVAYTGRGLTEDAFVRVSLPSPSSSLGAAEPSFGAVDRWILDHVEGFVWPGADVGLLREAAHAWRRAASAVALLADQVDVATSMVERQRSPEIPAALASLADVRILVADVAAELAAIAAACEEYAAAVEETQARTRALLAEIGQMVVEGAALSIVIGGLTGGLGGSATVAAAAARIRAQAPRFHALLVGLRATIATGAARMRTARESLQGLRARLDRYAKAAVRDERGEMRLPGAGRSGRPPGRPKPEVEDAKLQNYVDQLFKGVAQDSRTGDGTTMDAIRHELNHEELVNGKDHVRKGRDILRGLDRWLSTRTDVTDHDRRIAHELAEELKELLR